MTPVHHHDLQQLYQLSMEMLSIVRSDGTFKHVNPAWTIALGWAEDELVDQPYIQFVHPHDHDRTIREAERLAQGARAIDFENRYRAKDGTYRWMSWHVSPAADGKLLYCATRDVTDARASHDELRRARRDIQAILDHSPVVVFVTDVEGRYRMLNSASARITGRSPEELIGRTASDVFPKDVADMVRANSHRVMASGRSEMFEETLPTVVGPRTYSVVRFPLRNEHGDISALCGMSLDITEQKAAAEEIVQARAEAVRANRAKSDFLSRMSHELRTPLNAVLGFAQLFDRDQMSDGDRENIRQILDGGRHLLDLINEVIDISRVESGTLALSNEPVDVHDAVITAVSLMRPLAGAQGIVISVASPDPGLAVMADRQRLRQVLLNLLSNAVKYNRVNGTIHVAIDRVPTGRVRVSVQDTGAGIPPELLSLLFQPFERLGADKTAVEGTGLGLALSRALCQAMGGSLEVNSVVDQGSTFSIELAETSLAAPVEMERATTPAAPVSADDVRRSGIVVYIEDNVANVRLMERILSRRPQLTMMHAADGRSGIELVRSLRPSVVLLDLQLPEMSGDSVLRELWKDPLTRQIPIVVLTADATRGLPQRLMSAGARACLTKPLDVQQVLRTLDELIVEATGTANA